MTGRSAAYAIAWNGARLRICGIASTSTSGFSGAVHNWLTAARKREAA